MFQDTKTRFTLGIITSFLPGLFAILPLIDAFSARNKTIHFSMVGTSAFYWLIAIALYWLSIWFLAGSKKYMESQPAIVLRHGTQVVTAVFTFVVAFIAVLKFLFPTGVITWDLGLDSNAVGWLTTCYIALMSMSSAIKTADKWIKEAQDKKR